MISIDDFEARSIDELSLLKGDRIELIERDDDFGDGWYLGKHMQNEKTGLFPEGGYLNSRDSGMRFDKSPHSVHYNHPSSHQYLCYDDSHRSERCTWPF